MAKTGYSSPFSTRHTFGWMGYQSIVRLPPPPPPPLHFVFLSGYPDWLNLTPGWRETMAGTRAPFLEVIFQILSHFNPVPGMFIVWIPKLFTSRSSERHGRGKRYWVFQEKARDLFNPKTRALTITLSLVPWNKSFLCICCALLVM